MKILYFKYLNKFVVYMGWLYMLIYFKWWFKNLLCIIFKCSIWLFVKEKLVKIESILEFISWNLNIVLLIKYLFFINWNLYIFIFSVMKVIVEIYICNIGNI